MFASVAIRIDIGNFRKGDVLHSGEVKGWGIGLQWSESFIGHRTNMWTETKVKFQDRAAV